MVTRTRLRTVTPNGVSESVRVTRDVDVRIQNSIVGVDSIDPRPRARVRQAWIRYGSALSL